MLGLRNAFGLDGSAPLYQNNFFGVPNGAGWTGWVSNGGALSVANSAGVYSTNSTSAYVGGNAYLSSPVLTAGDVDFSGTVVMAAAAVEQYVEISIDASGSVAGAYQADQGYTIQLNYNATAASSTIQLNSVTGGATTAIAAAVTKTLVGTTKYGFRLQRSGTTVRFRVWDSSGAEPGTWDASATVATAYTGTVNLAVVNGGAAATRIATFDDLLVATPAGSGTAATGTAGLSGSGALTASGTALTGGGSSGSTVTETFTDTAGITWNAHAPTVWGNPTADMTARIATGGVTGALAGASTTAYAGGNILASGIAASSTLETTGTLVMSQTAVEQYVQIGLGNAGGYYVGLSGISAVLNYNATAASSTINLRQVDGAGTTNDRTTVTKSLTGTTTYSWRFKYDGTTAYFRIWTGTEPGTWDTSYAVSGLSGYALFGMSNGGAAAIRTANFDNVSITTAAGGGGSSYTGSAAFSGSGALTLPGGTTGTPTGPLAQWQTALSSVTTAPAKVMALGASFVEGQGASTRTGRWWDKFRVNMQTAYPSGAVGGDGYLPAWYGVYANDSPWGEWRTSSSGTVTNDQALPTLGQRTAVMSAGAIRTYTFTGTDLDIWYLGGTDAGSFTWKIDSGSATSVTAPGTYSMNNRVQVTGLSAASHTVTITATSKTYLAGFTVYNGDRNKGVQTYDSAHVSWETSKFTNLDSSYDALLNTIGPDLVILTDTSLNDASDGISVATVQSNTQTLITRIKALTKVPSILLIADFQPATNTSPAWSTYVSMLSALASSNSIAFLDMSALMGPATTSGLYSSDGLHPSTTGHTTYATNVTNVLSVTPTTTGSGVPTPTASIALSGSGTLTSTATTGYSGAAAFTGSGTLAPTTGTLTIPGAAALSGSGTLTTTSVQGATGTAGLSGSGTLSSTATPSSTSSIALSGSGTLATTGIPSASSSIQFSGSGTLAVTTVASLSGSAALSGSGTLTQTSTPTPKGTSAFSGSGMLSTAGSATLPGNAALTGSGALSVATALTTGSSVALSGSGTLSGAQGAISAVGSASFSGSGALTTAAVFGQSGTATFSGSGTLTVASIAGGIGSATLSGSGTLTAVSNASSSTGTAALTGSGTLTAAAILGQSGSAVLSGSGTLTLAVIPRAASSIALSGSGTLTASADAVSAAGSAAFSGTGTLVGVTVPAIPGTAVLSGSGTLTATTVAGAIAIAAFSGSGTLSSVQKLQAVSSIALSGSGALTTAALAGTVGTAAFTGTGALNSSSAQGANTSIDLSGSGTLSATQGAIAFTASAAFSGSGTLAVSSAPSVARTAAFTGSGTLTSAATLKSISTATLSGSGALTTAAILALPGTAGFSGSGALGTSSTTNYPGTADFSGSGALTGSATPQAGDTATLSGSGTFGTGTVLTRTNLAVNPAAASLSNFGTANGATLSLTTDPGEVISGGSSVKVTVPGNGITDAGVGFSSQYSWQASDIGKTFTLSVSIRSIAGGTYNTYTADNLSRRTITLAPGQVGRLSITHTVTGTGNRSWWILRTNGAVVDTYIVDELLIEQTPSTLPYFDGGAPSSDAFAAAWTGTPNASASTESIYAGTPAVAAPAAFSGSGALIATGVPKSVGTAGFSGSGKLATTAVLNRTNLAYNPLPAAVLTGWSYFLNSGTGTLSLLSGANPVTGNVFPHLAVTASAVAGGIYVNRGTGLGAVTAGKTYTSSAWVRTSVAGTVTPQIEFYDSASVRTGTPSASVSIAANTWTRVSVTGTAPAGSVAATATFYLGSASMLVAGATTDAAGFLFEATSSLLPYFDGSNTFDGFNNAWTGTPNNSTSTESVYAGVPSIAVPVAFSGSGTLTTASLVKAVGTLGLSGAGTLTIAAAATTPGTATLSGTGTLASSSAQGATATAAFSGSGTLAVTAQVSTTAAIALSGSGTLSLVAKPSSAASVALSGSGTLSTTGAATPVSTASFSGSGTLAIATKPSTAVSADLSGSGTLSSATISSGAASITLSGSGSLVASGTARAAAQVAFAGVGALVATAAKASAGSTAAFSGTGALAALVILRAVATAAFSSEGSLTATGEAHSALSDSYVEVLDVYLNPASAVIAGALFGILDVETNQTNMAIRGAGVSLEVFGNPVTATAKL